MGIASPQRKVDKRSSCMELRNGCVAESTKEDKDDQLKMGR